MPAWASGGGEPGAGSPASGRCVWPAQNRRKTTNQGAVPGRGRTAAGGSAAGHDHKPRREYRDHREQPRPPTGRSADSAMAGEPRADRPPDAPPGPPPPPPPRRREGRAGPPPRARAATRAPRATGGGRRPTGSGEHPAASLIPAHWYRAGRGGPHGALSLTPGRKHHATSPGTSTETETCTHEATPHPRHIRRPSADGAYRTVRP